MVSCPPLSAGPTRMCDSSPQDVRDTMLDDAALSIETEREQWKTRLSSWFQTPAQPFQREPRITLQKFPRTNWGSLSARTSAFTLPKVVSGLCLIPL